MTDLEIIELALRQEADKNDGSLYSVLHRIADNIVLIHREHNIEPPTAEKG